MYTGHIYLDFESDDEEAHYRGEISRCVIRGDELTFEFSGVDQGEYFSGSCTLIKEDDTCSGKGLFAYEGKESVISDVSASLDIDGSEILLHGTWHDENDSNPYKLDVELSEA